MTFICEMLLAILLAQFPVLLMLYYIYHKGEGRIVPFKVLVVAFIGGIMSVLPIHRICEMLYEAGLCTCTKDCQTTSETLWNTFVTAALLEELLKFCVLIVILKCAYKPRGGGVVVIAAFVGLGFAYVENLIYIMFSDNWLATGIARALMSVTDHFSYAVIMGTLYFYACHCHKARFLLYPLALLLPICLHWSGNAILKISGWSVILTPVWSITLFVFSCKLIKKIQVIATK